MTTFEPIQQGEVLTWEQPKFLTEDFRLGRNGSTIGTLTFRSGWGSFATGGVGSAAWTFKRQGFLRTRMTVRALGSDEDLAVFHPSTWSGGGALTISDGRSLQVHISFWQTRLDIGGSTGRPLLQYRPKGVFRQGPTWKSSLTAGSLANCLG